LDKIEVTNLASGKKVVFQCNKWLAKNKDDNEIARDLYPLESGRDSMMSGRDSSKLSVRSRDSQSRENTRSPKGYRN
jgi:hypothetical protein